MRYLVTAALPYANGPLHVGHLAGAYLPADIYVRYQKLKENPVLFICGSDENGVAITLKAYQEKTSPQKLVDLYHAQLEDTFKKLGIEFDIYHRTSSQLHHQTAQAFFLRLWEKGYVEARTTQQFYDPQAGYFLPDRYVQGQCPSCGYERAYGDQCERCGRALTPQELLHPISVLSGKKPVLKQTHHWFFRLDRFQEFLEQYIEEKASLWRPNVIGQCRSWLKEKLSPRAITRDLDWGVPVPLPEAAGKVLYVWFDAPIGYISATQAWAQQKGDPEAWKIFWQDPHTQLIHFIGKDNIVFHALIFPAMLQAHGDFILPAHVPANEFLTLEGQKISTSRQWAIWLHEYIQKAPARIDELRYYLTAIMPQTRDSDFSFEDFQKRVQNELIATWGNFIHRVANLLHRNYGGMPNAAVDSYAIELRVRAAEKIDAHLGGFDFRGALEALMEYARQGNRYLNEKAPWHPTSNTPSDLASAAEWVAALGTLSAPFMPLLSQKVRAQFRVPLYSFRRLLYPQPLLSFPHAIEPPQHLLLPMSDNEKITLQQELLPTQVTYPTQALIAYEDFAKIEVRVATVRAAERVPKTQKLLKLTLEIAPAQTKTVLSGIAEHYAPEELIGKQVLWVANLQPRTIRGIKSEGMILLAEDANGKLTLVSPTQSTMPGALVK
ncbi:MAG: methionine--tRNA ligase [Bacteroidia bacterium]